jgi:zinc-ribbon family
MIIWGTYVTKKIVSTGQFYCPRCANHRSYKLRRPKKWGHIYWIPIIPMQEFDRYVECDGCKGAYQEIVLQHDPMRAQHNMEDNLSHMICQIMSMMAGERGSVSLHLSDQIAASIRDILKVEMTPAAIHAAVSNGANDLQSVLDNVEQQAPSLSARGKDLVLRAALAAAPSPLSEPRRAFAMEIGKRLGMMPAHVGGVLAEFATN